MPWDFIIKLLGGYTGREMKDFKGSCSEWITSHLGSIKDKDCTLITNYEVAGDILSLNRKVYILGDSTLLSEYFEDRVIIAPWVSNTTFI